MQKTKRKKNRNKTNIAPSEMQKSLKNLRKINTNQKNHMYGFSPNLSSKNDQKSEPKTTKKTIKKQHEKTTKKRPKKEANIAPKWPQHGTPKRSKNEQKNNTKKEQKKERKKDRKKEPEGVKPDPAVNGKRRIQTFFVM